MHNNYYFLRVLAARLRQKLMYARVKQCFSQEKDELVIGFERQNSIRVNRVSITFRGWTKSG